MHFLKMVEHLMMKLKSSLQQKSGLKLEKSYIIKKFANGKSFANCFANPADTGAAYPMFDEKRKEVITLTLAINECLETNGEKKMGGNFKR